VSRAALAQPLIVVTSWGVLGGFLLGLLFVAITIAGFFYWKVVRSADRLSLPSLIAIVAVVLAAAWCVPVLFSSDVYAYAAYGELAAIGLNPYAHAPAGSLDPLLLGATRQWGSAFPICVYGPAFVGLMRAVISALAPLGTLAQLDGIRLFASAALVVCAPLAYVAFPGERAAKLRAAATIASNPVAIWCAAEGHNDAIALAIVLAGFALARRGLVGIGATIVAFSALVKLPGAIAAIALGSIERPARFGTVIGIALAALFSIPLFIGIATNFAPHARYGAQASLQGIFVPFSTPLALVIASGVSAGLAVCGTVRLRSGKSEGWVWLGLALWVLIPNPYPWYGLWLVALAALAPRTRAATSAILLSFTALLRYIPDAVGPPSPAQAVALSVLAALPLLALRPRWYNERPE
jgi:alpha-1,6-mannosyltransferase